jgi:DNA-binding NarL/FixJ family response regulator
VEPKNDVANRFDRTLFWKLLHDDGDGDGDAICMIQSATTKVILVDDDEMVRQGIQLLLENDGISVTGYASNGYEALSLVEQLQPDIVLLDINLPQLNGIEVAIQIHRDHPQIGVIMLTAHRHHDEVVRALQVGARGYVWKGSDFSELSMAIKAIVRGHAFISPAVSNDILSEYLNGAQERETTRERLTPRQRQVLQLIAEGHSNKDIACLLDLSVKGVEKHRTELMKRLDLHNTAGLVMYAVKSGVVKAA